MACLEHVCSDIACGWYIMDNRILKKCPECGKPVRSYLDEEGDGFDGGAREGL